MSDRALRAEMSSRQREYQFKELFPAANIIAMNPEETPDRQPAEIIDVKMVEPIAAESKPQGNPISSDNTEPNAGHADHWNLLLDELGQDLEPEPEVAATKPPTPHAPTPASKAQLEAEIERLRSIQAQLERQILDTQTSFGQVIQTSIGDLERQRQKLQISVEQLQRRRERIQAEINQTFAGASQDIAIRLQGFKDYLVGSLQDLVSIADEIEFPQPPPAQIRLQTPPPTAPAPAPSPKNLPPHFAEPTFKATAGKVRMALERYRKAPDYYAPAWQLRRSLEAVHADKVSDWFFSKDGRGAVKAMGSRLQNVLIASAAVSALREIYGDYLRTFVLANIPERLGDWRRGFQDCLGLSKADFGGNGGIILFEDVEAMMQKIDRVVANKEMPLIIIDNSDGLLPISLLQYPLWLAFAADLDRQLDDFREYR